MRELPVFAHGVPLEATSKASYARLPPWRLRTNKVHLKDDIQRKHAMEPPKPCYGDMFIGDEVHVNIVWLSARALGVGIPRDDMSHQTRRIRMVPPDDYKSTVESQ